MRQEQRKYEKEYKIQAVKLLKEIGARKTAAELGVPLHPVWMAESSTGGEAGGRAWHEDTRRSNEPGRGTGGSTQAGENTGERNPAAEGRERVFGGQTSGKVRHRHHRTEGEGWEAVISAIFDCFDLTVLALAMDDNMRAGLCVRTQDIAVAAYPGLRGAIVHSDRGSQVHQQRLLDCSGKIWNPPKHEQVMAVAVTTMHTARVCGTE